MAFIALELPKRQTVDVLSTTINLFAFITPLAYTECIYVIMEQLLTNNGAPRLLVQIGGRAHTLIIVECIDTIVGAA